MNVIALLGINLGITIDIFTHHQRTKGDNQNDENIKFSLYFAYFISGIGLSLVFLMTILTNLLLSIVSSVCSILGFMLGIIFKLKKKFEEIAFRAIFLGLISSFASISVVLLFNYINFQQQL